MRLRCSVWGDRGLGYTRTSCHWVPPATVFRVSKRALTAAAARWSAVLSTISSICIYIYIYRWVYEDYPFERVRDALVNKMLHVSSKRNAANSTALILTEPTSLSATMEAALEKCYQIRTGHHYKEPPEALTARQQICYWLHNYAVHRQSQVFIWWELRKSPIVYHCSYTLTC